ncbi:tyrosine-type recombinase/integrase [Candidatus Bipolaricaulota bacterium]
MQGKRNQRGRKLPEVLTTQEQAALLNQPNPRYPTGERNRLMMSVMLNTGLRLSEATGLQWRDLDLNSGKLFVRQGKGAKDRVLWVGSHDLLLLRQWKERQAATAAGFSGHVFTTLDGKPVSGRYVQQMVKRYAVKAEIEKNIHPHTLRHTFATDLHRESRNIRLVQKVLGHADLSTTMIYTHVHDEEVATALKSLRDSQSDKGNASRS